MVVKGTKGNIVSINEITQNIMTKNDGYITRKELTKRGISSIYLTRYVKKCNLKKVARGIYAVDEWIIDPYFVFQYTYPKFIYSFNSAIYLHGLGDILPNYLEVTGPINYRPFPNKKEGIFTHTDTVNKSYNLGIIEAQTPLGNTVKVYDKEKTICDLIRNKEKVELEVYVKALNIYAKLKNKDVNKLMKYAKIMGIEDKVFNLMEILLN